jgi:hypothetical protein
MLCCALLQQLSISYHQHVRLHGTKLTQHSSSSNSNEVKKAEANDVPY